jgi:hypothetical protein
MEKGIIVLSRDGKEKGVTTGGERPCTMDGCGGTRIAVRWAKGNLTLPCVKGMADLEDGTMKIV